MAGCLSRPVDSRGGRLSTFLNGGIVYTRLAKTGALLYSGRLGAMGYYYASPVAADHKVFIASEEGSLLFSTPATS